MKNERLGNYYRLFTLKINGINYYFIADVEKDGFLLLFDDSEQAVDWFENMERDYERCSKYWNTEKQ